MEPRCLGLQKQAPRTARACAVLLAALGLLVLVPPVHAWQYNPDDPTNLPLVGHPDPTNLPDPAPITVPKPPVFVPELGPGSLGHVQLLLIGKCFDFGCVYVSAGSGDEKACGGIIRSGATINLPDTLDVYVEQGHDKGVYGGYSSRCYERNEGLTIDL